jgi:signal transduction histidine kinase
MQKLLILLCLFLITEPVAAQLSPKNHIQQYTTENGLPSNGIKGMQWDEKTNFLWIATEAGIVRFNGVDFSTYTRENMPSIQSERMLFIVRNNAGSIYFSDLPGNLFLIDRNKPTLWKQSPGKINPFYSNYYLLPVSDTFFEKNRGDTKNTQFSAVTDKIDCLSDTSCIILNQGTLYYQSINLRTPARLPYEPKIFNSLFKIGNNSFVANNKKEIFLITNLGNSILPVPVVNEDGSRFTPTSNNLLYWETGMQKPVFIEGNKAWLFDYAANKITARLVFDDIPADAYIRSIQYSEKNKILFIGTDSKGLIVLSQNRVESKKRINVNSKNRNSYYAQIELENGNILTNEGDIIGDNTGNENPLPVKGKFAYSMSVINDSLLWYFQQNNVLGISCMHMTNKRTGQTKVFRELKNESIITNAGGNLFAANPTGILQLISDSFRYVYKNPLKIVGNLLYDIKEIETGILFLATCAGILRYNISTALMDTVLSNQNGCIRNIRQYKDYVFFGSYGSGYFIYKNGKIKPMPLDKNRYLLYTHCFVLDERGYCWISTNRGLFMANADEMINAFENNSKQVYYHYFGKKDGMEMTELNGGCTPCALELKNKSLSFPTMDGLLWVDPAKVIPILPEGEIFIDEMLADNKTINIDSLHYKNLPAQTVEIILKLGFSDWCNKENIYLDYQLNDTTNWKPINTDNETFIRLASLSPGKYILRIRKMNGFGKNNYSYKSIAFIIATPWYKQWWFYFLLVAAVLGMFILFYRVRVNQLKLNQAKLERQVTDKTEELQQKNNRLEKSNSINNRLISIISHDIITPLKFLNVAGKNLLEKKQLMTEELKDETIKEITTTSKELQLLRTNILNWIKYQNENRRLVKEQFYLHDMLNQIFSILNSMAHQKNLKLISNVDAALLVTQYFEPLKILIYNLVTNAIHFSDNGMITVNAIQTEEKIIISVSDEGIGMTAEQIKNIMADQFIVSSANMDNKKGNGLGYLIIKDLLKMMNSELSINSEKARPDGSFGRGKGTTVYVELPK